MKTYRYTSPENKIVAVIDEDGASRTSILASLVPDGAQILPFVAPPAAVPAAVTMRQARLALLGAGLLSQVDAAIASMPSPQKEAATIEWEFANAVERNSAFTQEMGAVLGMTESQIDDLFFAAAAL